MKKGYGAIDDKIRDRYHGINDPVANKILSKIKEKSKLPEAPADMSITTLFVGGVTETMSELDILEQMEPFGKVAKVKLLPKHLCGFICFNAREGAQKALNTLYDKFFVAD